MAKVLFKRIEDSANINNIEIEDGSFIVTGDGKTYVDYGEDRIPTSSTPDTEMSDRSRNTVENNVIKDYVDTNIQDIYSTNEIKTHKVWIDNKPIYRKVYSVSSKSNIDLSTLDYDYINIVSTIMVVSGYVRNPYYSTNSDYFRTLITNAKKLVIETNVSSISNWTTILEYTKTTD